MSDPLMLNHVEITTKIVFPSPGIFDLVLVANGDEISRQRFAAVLATPSKTK